MSPVELAKLQAYLRKTFANERITIDPPPKRGASAEMRIGDEFIGVIHRDEEEGEVSYALHITILEDDLPPSAAPNPGQRKPR
ncbi:MAG TPA: DUF3126 family protein [Stellaceae bacterium]